MKESKANTDTTRGLSIKEVIDMVHNNHPLVVSSRMESTRGKATLRKARGAFDPRFQIETEGKSQEYVNQFGNPGKFTYEKEVAHLSLPTRSPIKFETGYESGRGNLVNSENYTLKGGLRYAGISMPVLKGLITDERRTTLAKSKLFKSQSIEIQKIQLLNLSEVVWKDYVLWLIAFQQRNAYATGAQLSLERQEALRELFKAGGCNGMDTLENYIQLELFRTREKEWRVNTTKQRLQLSRHLWDYNKNTNEWSALGISEDTEPSEDFFNYLDSLFQSDEPNKVD
ncbi:MAG: TolC family protein, partial [Bacteroidota bacterium]|nr:TolC family protein [Bacteroidota bacterium]